MGTFDSIYQQKIRQLQEENLKFRYIISLLEQDLPPDPEAKKLFKSSRKNPRGLNFSDKPSGMEGVNFKNSEELRTDPNVRERKRYDRGVEMGLDMGPDLPPDLEATEALHNAKYLLDTSYGPRGRVKGDREKWVGTNSGPDEYNRRVRGAELEQEEYEDSLRGKLDHTASSLNNTSIDLQNTLNKNPLGIRIPFFNIPRPSDALGMRIPREGPLPPAAE